MVKRGPDGKFQSGGSIMHRATANVIPDSQDDSAGVLDEPLYTWQAPDTDRTVVGTLLAVPGRPGEATGAEKRNMAEISFDANAAMVQDGTDDIVDDTRSSVLHAAGTVEHSDGSGVHNFGVQSVVPQNAEWRRGTELFLHSFQKFATAQKVRAIVYYTEG